MQKNPAWEGCAWLIVSLLHASTFHVVQRAINGSNDKSAYVLGPIDNMPVCNARLNAHVYRYVLLDSDRYRPKRDAKRVLRRP